MEWQRTQDRHWLSSIPERLSYAWQAPEQRFEWSHLTRRRAFRNLCNVPGELIGWSITTKARGNKRLFPDLSKVQDYHTPGQLIDSSLFTGILFKQALDIGAKFGLSSFVKSTVSGYNRNEDYRELLDVSSLLRHLAADVVQQDRGLQDWAQKRLTRDESPLAQLSLHADQANQVMMEFCQGGWLPTQENIRLLQLHLDAIGDLCDRKAGLLDDSRAQASPLEHPALPMLEHYAPDMVADARYGAASRPSNPIRAVLSAEKLSTPAQAAIYLSTLSGLVMDGALEISSEIFTPKDQSFFSAKDAKLVAATLKKFQNGQKEKTVTPDSVLALANQLKQALHNTDAKLAQQMSYADLHYADIDGQLLHPQEQERAQAPAAPSSSASSRVQKPLSSSYSPQDGSAPLPKEYYEAGHVGLKYVFRNQARHEMGKLYSRSLPTYLYQAPINLIERLILPNANGKWEFNGNIVKKELQAATWMAAYNPAAESFGGVSTYEATRLDLHKSVESGKRADAFLSAALEMTRQADPDFAAQMEALKTPRHFRSLIDAHRDVLQKPANQRTAEDYAAMGELMRHLSESAETHRKESLSLLTGDKDKTVQTHLGGIFSHGVRHTGDALMVITLLRFLEHAAEDEILSYEYTDPAGKLFDKDSLRKFSSGILRDLRDAGYAISGESVTRDGERAIIGEKEGIPPGQLVHIGNDGATPLTRQECIGFANHAVDAIHASGAPILDFLTRAEGRMGERYVQQMEQAVWEQFSPPAAPSSPSPSMSGADQRAITPASVHRPKKRVGLRDALEYVRRPEAVHEMHLLRDRYLAVALFGFPVKIMTNILRGDFNKISTALGKWSLASTAFSTVANTLAPSFGAVAMKEVASIGNIALKRDAEEAHTHLQSALSQLGNTDDGLRQRLISGLAINPLLEKSTLERLSDSHGTSLLDDTASTLIAHTVASLAGETKSAPPPRSSADQTLDYIFSLPNGQPAYAAMKLAALDALIGHEQSMIGVLRFEGSTSRLMDRNQFKRLVDHVEDRFYQDGASLAKATPEALMEFADSLGSFALDTLRQSPSLQPAANAAERLKSRITHSLSSGLTR